MQLLPDLEDIKVSEVSASLTAGKEWIISLTRAVNDTAIPMILAKNGAIVYSNKAFCEKFGNLSGQMTDMLFDSESIEFFRWLMDPEHMESDKTVLTISGGKMAGKKVLVQFWPFGHTFTLFSMQDNYSSRRIADIDELTLLPNRRKANLLLEIEKHYLHRSEGFCLAFADIDHFKQINDTYGHEVGDKVLRHVAEILNNGLRESDWIARWGGEEFLIFVRGNDLVMGLQAIRRIHMMLQKAPFIGPPELPPVTMSMGLVSSTEDTDINKMIEKADVLMFDAKNAGRNRIVCENDDSIWFAHNIEKVVRDGGIIPLYTPLVAANSALLAVKISHGLLGKDEDEAQKMLMTANHLRMRQQVDGCLLDKIADCLPVASDIPYFFPVSNELIVRRTAMLAALFKKYDYLCAGISTQQPLSEENLNFFAAEKVPLALIDFTPHAAPMSVLGHVGLQHIVYSSPGTEADRVLTVFPSVAKCYAANVECAPCAGFAGYLKSSGVSRLEDIGGNAV